MKIEVETKVEYFVITDVKALDPVTVILKDEDGRGKVVAECYGESWSTYFGGIGGDKSLVKFLSGLDACYLEGRFVSNTFHRPTKREKDYVNRICQAVIDSCKLKESFK